MTGSGRGDTEAWTRGTLWRKVGEILELFCGQWMGPAEGPDVEGRMEAVTSDP